MPDDELPPDFAKIIAELPWEEPEIPHLPLRLRECCRSCEAELAALRVELEIERARRQSAEKVVEAARWACVAVLDQTSDAETLAEVRPLAAQELVETLEKHDKLRQQLEQP